METILNKESRAAIELMVADGIIAKDTAERYFPELKESEDGKMMRVLIGGLKSYIDMYSEWYDGVSTSEIIAWLEKQGEPKSYWKPSKDEMDALYGLAYITNTMDDKKDEAVTKLYQDLKREFFNGASYENMFPSSPVDAPIKDEKQGEQKPADMVEPKFKIGDWIVCCDYEPEQIIGIRTNVYEMSNGDIRPFYIIDNNHNIRIWTIEDAKDGDILVFGKEKHPFIFKGLLDKFHPDKPVAYCGIGYDNEFCITAGISWWTDEEVEPAIKEQRDLLFKKMKEAGYEWDADKKELKEIKKKPKKCMYSKDDYTDEDRLVICDGCNEICELKQKPAWSEEDVAMIDSAIAFVEHSPFTTIGKGKNNVIAWLKSIKDKAQPQLQLKQEWSEEDKNMLQSILDEYKSMPTEKRNWLKFLKDRVQPQPQQQWSEKYIADVFEKVGLAKIAREQENDALTRALQSAMIELAKYSVVPQIRQEWSEEDEQMMNSFLHKVEVCNLLTNKENVWIINKLKSLKDKHTWKPSDEQMEALDDFIYAKYPNIEKYGASVKSLYQDLKKLREE